MKPLGILFAIAISQAAAAAVITNGTITITGTAPTGAFNFGGPGFAASGAFSDGVWGPTFCVACAPGSVLSVNGTEVGNDFSSGSATVGASSFANVQWGDLNASGISIFTVSGPGIVLNAGAGIYHGTFSLTGSLCGTQGNAIPNPCVVNLPSLTGVGTVAVTVASVSGGLAYQSATYMFTPEPGTWVLVLIGGAAMLGLRFRKSSS